jgi:hypothetical protein
LKQGLTRNLNLDVDDPEEILTRFSGRNVKAGLWLLLGVVHYNMKNYKAGSIAKMTDSFRKQRWQRKKRSRKYFETLCTVFESPGSFGFVFFFFYGLICITS